jgi:hypothetical protein
MTGTTLALLLMLGIPLGPLAGFKALHWWEGRQLQERRRKALRPERRPPTVRSHVVAFARTRGKREQ